jgi:50S ribosomal protein L16 3-hydroxylase
MQRRCAQMLASIRWGRDSADCFLGAFLSGPKPSVFFAPPAPMLSLASFRAKTRRHGIRLDLRSQLLYDDRRLYMNGSAMPWPSTGAPTLRRLANERKLPRAAIAAAAPRTIVLLYDWYRDGYLHPDR